jgi:hypothetical protein
MGLSPEQIQAIYAKKAAQPKRGGGKRKAVDYNDRTYKAWFALEHTDPEDRVYCSNPDCLDPNGRKWANPPDTAEQVVADVITEESGVVRMCRYCFTIGWLTKRENQDKLSGFDAATGFDAA